MLYHGTTTFVLESIWNHGLRPGDGRGNLGDAWPSRPGFVYLTSANPIHFAGVAWHASGLKSFHGDLLIVEVAEDRLDDSQIYPDDEYLAAKLGLSKDEYTRHADRADCDPLQQQGKWRDSLLELRSIIFHGAIAPDAITRYAIIHHSAFLSGVYSAVNKHASIKSNAIVGDVTAALVRYLFDGDADAFMRARVEFLRCRYPDDDADDIAMKEMRRLQRERVVTVIDNRPGQPFPQEYAHLLPKIPESLR